MPIAGIFLTAYFRACGLRALLALHHAAAVLPPNAPEIAKALSSAAGWACVLTSLRITILRTRLTVNGPDFEKSAHFLSGFGRLQAVFGFQ